MGILAVLAIVILFLIELALAYPTPWLAHAWGSRRFRWPIYCAAFYSVVFFGVFERIEFIYFQF